MSIYDTHKPTAGEGSGLYLKIQDGETVKLRIASEPAIFETEGERDGKTTISTRYGWVVFNQETKQAQILQQSATFFKNLAALAQDEEWGDPTGYDIKITRKGSNFNDTTYTITPSNNRAPLNSEARELVRAVDLIEKLEASPFSQRVMWLADFDHMDAAPRTESKGQAAQPEPDVDSPPAPKEEEKDVIIEDIGDEPINLDDIPF